MPVSLSRHKSILLSTLLLGLVGCIVVLRIRGKYDSSTEEITDTFATEHFFEKRGDVPTAATVLVERKWTAESTHVLVEQLGVFQPSVPPTQNATNFGISARLVAGPQKPHVAVVLAVGILRLGEPADQIPLALQQVLDSPEHLCEFTLKYSPITGPTRDSSYGTIVSRDIHADSESHAAAVLHCSLPSKISDILKTIPPRQLTLGMLVVRVTIGGLPNTHFNMPVHLPLTTRELLSFNPSTTPITSELFACYKPISDFNPERTPRYLIELIEYHRQVGVVHSIFYLNKGNWFGDSSTNPELLSVLKLYQGSGYVTFIDTTNVDDNVNAGNNNNLIYMNDCLLRFADSPRLVFIGDVDDWLISTSDTVLENTLTEIVEADTAAIASGYEKNRTAIFSFSRDSDVILAMHLCTPTARESTLSEVNAALDKIPWTLERIQFIQPHVANVPYKWHYFAISALVTFVQDDNACCKLKTDSAIFINNGVKKMHGRGLSYQPIQCVEFASAFSPKAPQPTQDFASKLKVIASAVSDRYDLLIERAKRNIQQDAWGDVDNLVIKNAKNNNIIVASVNSGFIDFAINWLCTLQRVGLTNYIFHAVDQAAYETLTSRGLPVLFYESSDSRLYRAVSQKTISDPLEYGSVAYQAVMSSRTELVGHILNSGYNVLLSDVDIILLRDPFLFFDMTLDIQGGAHQNTSLTGGFLYLRSTIRTIGLWDQMRLVHQEMLKTIQASPSYHPDLNTEQWALNTLLKKSSGVLWKPIPDSIVASGKHFFIEKNTLRGGEWPAAIHNNWIIGHENKLQRFKNISMWLVDENLNCKKFPADLPAPPSKNKFTLVIKILAFNRPEPLKRLFESLLEEDYGTDKVNIDIFIDSAVSADPDETPDPDQVKEQKATVKVAKAFKWSHGLKSLTVRKHRVGLAMQWLSCWPAESDLEVAMILEDDNVVVKGFYGYLKKGISKYYYDKKNYDPRVFGFNLQHTTTIPGRYPTPPDDLLPPNTMYYKYQLLSTWGPVFFPGHWRNFTAWFKERVDTGFNPLFSNLITNKWFLERGGGKAVWSAWFIRFAAERGIYSIYTNFPNKESLIINWREKGNNFAETKGPNSPPVKEITKQMLNFPPLHKLPLYDLHFNLITENPSILEDRGLYADPSLHLE